jgi:hypothetical protein
MPLQKKRARRESGTAERDVPPGASLEAAQQLGPPEPSPEMLALRGALPARLEWSYNPWLDSRERGWRRPPVAMLVLLGCSAIAGYSLAVPRSLPAMFAWGGLAFVLAVLMCAALFLPVRYRLDKRGVLVTFMLAPSFRPWEHYRNFYVHDTGVHLTTMPQPSALDPFRGHFIQYGRGGQRREVVDYLSAYIARPERAAAATETQNSDTAAGS